MNPNSEFIIRPYEHRDSEQVRWLHLRTPAWGNVAWRPEPTHPEIDRPHDFFAGFWVAAEMSRFGEEMVVGIAGVHDVNTGALENVTLPPFVERSRRLARLDWMQVAPERWRCGIGRGLARGAITWCREQGFEALVLDTTVQQLGAIALYESVGFKRTGVTVHGPWETQWMEHPLE